MQYSDPGPTEPNNTDTDTEDYTLPEELFFNFPDEIETVKLVVEDDVLLFRQLVCWCLVQRYRYYVLNRPMANDSEYDYVEKFVIEMREGAEYLKEMFCPLTEPGSSRIIDYPGWIRYAFRKIRPRR